MNPIYHNEIIHYIGKRLKMILNKNIYINSIYSYINSKKNKVKIKILFIFMKKAYSFINIYYINTSDINYLENIICIIVDEFEIQLNNII